MPPVRSRAAEGGRAGAAGPGRGRARGPGRAARRSAAGRAPAREPPEGARRAAGSRSCPSRSRPGPARPGPPGGQAAATSSRKGSPAAWANSAARCLAPTDLAHHDAVGPHAKGVAHQRPDRHRANPLEGTAAGSRGGRRGAARCAARRRPRSSRGARPRRGRVAISLGCPLAETLGCRGRVRLVRVPPRGAVGRSRAPLRLGSARFRIGGGRRRPWSSG
jgi:hypothetical protein